MQIPGGCILLARKVIDSEIWYDKPAWWLKVWLYILMKTNHSGKGKYKPGEQYFDYGTIYHDCRLRSEGLKKASLKNVFSMLKDTTQITTRKATRGFIITICNWESYQTLDNYKNHTENHMRMPNRTTAEPQPNHTKKQVLKSESMKVKSVANKFAPPALDEILRFVEEKNLCTEAENFFYYYESNGWMVGKNKMQDWKSALMKWHIKDQKDSKTPEQEFIENL